MCRMCKFFEVSRSGYYDFLRRLGKPEKDSELADIIAAQRECSSRTYGYRRMWLWLEGQAIHRNPKTVLRVMRKYNLLCLKSDAGENGGKWGNRYISMKIY